MRRVLVTGASRGIGREIARAFAKHETHLVVTIMGRSHSVPSHPSLEGTLVETAREIEAMGHRALAKEVDFRNPLAVAEQTTRAVDEMQGCDVVVHNASALSWKPQPRDVSLVLDVNLKSTLVINNVCRPHLTDGGGSIVSLSPPVHLGRLEWLSTHPAYTISKYGMTLATLSEASDRVRGNCLWPRHTVATSATRRLEDTHPGAYTLGRPPDVIGEAVYRLAVHETSHNAACLYDDQVLPLPRTRAPLDLFAEEDVRLTTEVQE
jgi:citronellol/citronellal dehydrogenase